MKQIYTIFMMLALMVAALSFTACSSDDNDEEGGSEGGSEGSSYVDLGLPSGTLWATCNIGASSPEDRGDFFAWGETKGYNSGKTRFAWSTYKWCNGSYNSLTKYCNNGDWGYNGFTDYKTKLELEDDAAYVNWGPAWRMPSYEQFQELIGYTTYEFTTLNDIGGYKFTSKTNDKSIFLPTTGYRDDELTGWRGHYWSCTLSQYEPDCAWRLYFDRGFIKTNESDRRIGICVRPVRVLDMSTK